MTLLGGGSLPPADLQGVLSVSSPTVPGPVPAPPTTIPAPARRPQHDAPAVAAPAPVTTPATPTWRRRLLKPAASRLITSVDAAALLLFPVLIPEHRIGLLTFAVIAFVMLRIVGLQRARLSLSVLDDLPLLAVALLAATGLTAGLRVIVRNDTSSQHLLKWLVLASGVVVLERCLSYAVVRWARRAGLVSHPTVIIGCGVIGAQLSRALMDNPQYGLRPVGFLDDEPLLTSEERPVPLLAGTDQLADVIEANGIHNVIVAFSSRNELDVIDVLRTCDRLGVEIFAVPRLFEVSAASSSETVRGTPLIRLGRPTYRSRSWCLKRAFDILVAATALVLLSPLLLVCAIAVRLEGGPGIIFRQRRVGIDGTTFDLLKFRSLKPASEAESATTWNISLDERMGPVGRNMRRLSLDELPQLWNILKGDMSVVGPRPERPHFVDRFGAEHREYLHRHRVPCGLTGWAQVNGLRGDTSIRERARFDNYYIENWSLWLDLKIVLRTFAQVIRMAGG